MIAFAGNGATFVDCPDNQGLATAHVAGGKYFIDIGLKVAVFCFYVGAGVEFETRQTMPGGNVGPSVRYRIGATYFISFGLTAMLAMNAVANAVRPALAATRSVR